MRRCLGNFEIKKILGRFVMKIGRNELCPCGSGLKYKKCCICHNGTAILKKESTPDVSTINLKSISPFSSCFRMMLSFEFNGYRLRFVFGGMHYCPLNETFHDFLLNIINKTFGSKWGASQSGMSEENKHVVFSWFEDLVKFRKEFTEKIETESTPHGLILSAEMDGPQQALFSFAWDLFCLQIKGKISEDHVKKLKDNNMFQSFRYEIAVAAIMVRSGFEIEWYDTSGKDGKKSEFIATHLRTGLKVTVEAKSIRRIGVLNEKGVLDRNDDKLPRIAKQLKAAEKKKEKGIPHLVFIDINRPPHVSDITSDINYIKKLIDAMPIVSADKPAKHEVLIMTNFSPYYGGIGKLVPKDQHFISKPNYCNDEIDSRDLDEIINSLNYYSYIPNEI
jgi:hypothetical protein